jgi:hypothetical protein
MIFGFKGVLSFMRYLRKLHNEELNNLYSLSNIVRVVKSRRMGWVGHVVHMREEVLVGNLSERAIGETQT